MLENQAEQALVKVERETGVSRDDQIESMRMLSSLASKQLDVSRDLGGKIIDLMAARENSQARMAEIAQMENDSRRNYNLARNSSLFWKKPCRRILRIEKR